MKPDSEFVSDFMKSIGPVMAVAAHLSSLGIDTKINPIRLRPHSAVREEFYDEGDLVVSMPVEVKQRTFNFSGPHDYPYDSVFVAETYKIPRDFFQFWILSNDMTCAAIIGRHTQPSWSKIEKYDKAQDRKCIFASCPIDLVIFIPMKPGVFSA